MPNAKKALRHWSFLGNWELVIGNLSQYFNCMRRIAVIIYGPPGSGKSTQADFIAEHFGLIRIDSGKIIEESVYDPANRNDPLIQEQKKLFESGKLCEPSWALQVISKRIEQIMAAGFGAVMSGSPRTAHEAFGSDGKSGEYALLTRGYGNAGIFIFSLAIDPEKSAARNAKRFICPVDGHQFLAGLLAPAPVPTCPICSAPLKTRTLDKPEARAERIKEFQNRTEPILTELRRRGCAIISVNADQPPYKVFEDIKRWLS